MSFDDIFNLNETDFDNIFKDPEMSKDKYITEAKKLFQLINKCYADSWVYPSEDLEEDLPCRRCGGFTQVIEGGESVDCSNCHGTGSDPIQKVFDHKHFSTGMEEIIFDSASSKFYELLSCKITNG